MELFNVIVGRNCPYINSYVSCQLFMESAFKSCHSLIRL